MAWIRLDLPGAEILFSDRTGGVSAPPFDTANAGYARGDDPANVDENRGRIAAGLGGRVADPATWTCLRQVHGPVVFCGFAAPPGAPSPGSSGGRGPCDQASALRAPTPGRNGSGLPEADAAVSTEPDAVLAILTADCAPVALVAPGVIGAVHAGWRGVTAGVIEAAVAEVRQRSSGPVRAVLGPCIHPECYEFSATDLDPIAARLGSEVAARTADGQLALDLPRAAQLALTGVGVTDIIDIDVCTACSADHFSHRRDGRRYGTTGLQTMLVAAR